VGEGGANTSPHLLLDLLFKHLPLFTFSQSEGRNVEVVCFSLGAEGYCAHCHWCEDKVRLEEESVGAAARRIAEREVRPGEGAEKKGGKWGGKRKTEGEGRVRKAHVCCKYESTHILVLMHVSSCSFCCVSVCLCVDLGGCVGVSGRGPQPPLLPPRTTQVGVCV
jgi:hypothetical protein